MKRLCAATVLFLASVSSAQTTIWGVTLGKPLNLPICTYENTVSSCQGEPLSETDERYTSNKLNLVVGHYTWTPWATEIGGNLESMSIDIARDGLVLNCDNSFAGLKEKFGQPSGATTRAYHNGLGMPLSVTTFVWNRKNGDQVSFSIPYPEIDECQFTASTLKWRSLKPNKVKF